MKLFSFFRSKQDPSKKAIDEVSSMAAAIKWGNLVNAESILNRQNPVMLQAMYSVAQHVSSRPNLQGDIDQRVWDMVLSMIQEKL